MSPVTGRSPEALSVEVDALHAQLAAVVAILAAGYRADGLAVPAALGGPGSVRAADTSPQRHLSLVVSR